MSPATIHKEAFELANTIADCIDQAQLSLCGPNALRHLLVEARNGLHQWCSTARRDYWHEVDSDVYLALFDALSLLNSALAGHTVEATLLKRSRDQIELARNLALPY